MSTVQSCAKRCSKQPTDVDIFSVLSVCAPFPATLCSMVCEYADEIEVILAYRQNSTSISSAAITLPRTCTLLMRQDQSLGKLSSVSSRVNPSSNFQSAISLLHFGISISHHFSSMLCENVDKIEVLLAY